MTITFVSDTALPVLRYGGTERIVYWLMKELVKMGHSVHLIAPRESRVDAIGATLIPMHPGSDWRALVPRTADLVHSVWPSLQCDVPTLFTVHGNGAPGETFPRNTVFVSRRHAELHGSDQFVYNGLDLDEYPMVREPRTGFNRFLFLAKATWPVKNLDDCIRATRAVRKHLDVAGGTRWRFCRNRRRAVLTPRVSFHGMVSQDQKLPLLQRADALLWPVRWNEPFGIAMIEAFSQGLPVVGSAYGSVPEIVTPECGIVCHTYQEFQHGLSTGENRFDPRQIRRQLETRFSASIMARNYVACYERILDGEYLNPTPPATVSPTPAETLLPF